MRASFLPEIYLSIYLGSEVPTFIYLSPANLASRFRCASNAQNSLAAGSCACRAPPAPQHCRDAPRHVLVVGAGGRARRRPRRQRCGRPDLRVRSLCGKAAAQRRRPIRPPARPASVRLSPGQPPASASLNQPRVKSAAACRRHRPRFQHRYAAEGKPLARGMRQLLEEGEAIVNRAPVSIAGTKSMAGRPPCSRPLHARPR